MRPRWLKRLDEWVIGEAKKDGLFDWHDWYAWYPVWLPASGWSWLVTLRRHGTHWNCPATGIPQVEWTYRLKDK